MTAAAFDTYTAAKRLRDAGFDERQAEAAVSMVRDATGAERDALATKADLDRFATKTDLAGVRDALRDEIHAGIDSLRKETKADLHREIGALRSELRWMLGFLAALILAMAAKLFGIV